MTSTLSPPDQALADGLDLHDLLARFSVFGRTAKGGVTRLAGSPADGQARDLFTTLLRESGADVRVDEIGNQFGLFSLASQPQAPLVMMGSHLDSQIRAGRLDGTLGVAAALCVGQTLLQAKRRGTPFDADFCVVNWTNEEGARFRPSLLGSGTYAGSHAVADALSRTDDAGTQLGDALKAIGYGGVDQAPPLPACYLELHVEQGTVLETAGVPIGVVGRNWGAIKIEAVFEGVQAHTGPGSMARRRDALLGAAYAIAQIRSLADRWPGLVHTSVGRMLVEPNSANVVPARVTLSVEIRAADSTILTEAGQDGDSMLIEAAAHAQVGLTIEDRTERPVRDLPVAVSDLVAACAGTRGLKSMRMDTVAGHDALSLLGLCPIGLIFVPSIGGTSHNEGEATATADLDAGLAVLGEAAWRLCTAGGDPHRALRRRDGGAA